MTKRDKLDILMLLSAIESWSFADGKMMPDYLHEGIDSLMDKLREEVLETESHPAMQSDRGTWYKKEET